MTDFVQLSRDPQVQPLLRLSIASAQTVCSRKYGGGLALGQQSAITQAYRSQRQLTEKVLRSIRRVTMFGAFHAVVLLGVLSLIVACAPAVVQHAFSFNATDAPGVEIVDYRYGDSRQPGARADPEVVASMGRVRQSLNVIGEIRRPDSLYVRWRDLITGKTYEDTVDLARLLPREIARHRIHFTARGSRLFVYLITPYRRGPDDPVNGPRMYDDLKVITLSADFGREVEAK